MTKAMAAPESGLEVRDRMWLKITIPNAFLGMAGSWTGGMAGRPRLGTARRGEASVGAENLSASLLRVLPGSDVVDWLYHHVEGFPERREARKYASGLLKAGLIRHTVNKITFSEQCYYVFGDLSGGCESCECLCWPPEGGSHPAPPAAPPALAGDSQPCSVGELALGAGLGDGLSPASHESAWDLWPWVSSGLTAATQGSLLSEGLVFGLPLPCGDGSGETAPLEAVTFGLLSCFPDLVNLSLNDNDGSSGASDQDTLAPLPGATPWPLLPTFSYQYPAPHPYSPQPPPYHELSSYTYGGGSASSQHSEGKSLSDVNAAGGWGWPGQGDQGGEAGAGEAKGGWARAQVAPSPPPPQGAGAVGQRAAMGGQGVQGGLRSGPQSPSPAVAVSLSPPAVGAASGGAGIQAGLMGALPLPEARQGVLPISEPTLASIPTDRPPGWPSPTIP